MLIRKNPSSVSGKPQRTTGFAQSFRIGRITDPSERQGKAITDSALTLPAPQSDLAQEMPRDPSIFGFLTIRARQGEKELKDALLENVRRLLMEPGSGFAFVGREYRLVVGQTEQFPDLLFCNDLLHGFVVVEVKVSAFDPRDRGRLGTCAAAVDERNQIIRPSVC